jgi:hypothetical protein
MTGLLADVVVLIVMDEYDVAHVAVRWNEPAVEQALIAWAKKEFHLTLPKTHAEALEEVNNVIGNQCSRYRYEIHECRIGDI